MRSKSAPKIVISGYYGFGNCGDEAVLLSMIHCLRKLRPDIRITVLSANPEKTRELYGVDAVNRWNPILIKRELLFSNLLISGGGSLLQDVTSARSPAYYLGVIRLALFLRKKVMIYSQGIGPLTVEKNRKKTAKVLNRCHVITLRDKTSAELLKELGVKRDIHVTCDPVMALGRDDVETNAVYEELREMGIFGNSCEPRKPLLVAAVRCWKDDRHLVPVAEFLDAQSLNGYDVLLVPAHYPDDMDAIVNLRDHMSARVYSIDRCLTAREFIALTALASKVFSMRLHGLICAMAMGTPMLALSYDPKVDAFMEQAGQSKYCLAFDSFDSELAKRLMAELGELPDDSLKARELRRSEMQKLAWETAGRVLELGGLIR